MRKNPKESTQNFRFGKSIRLCMYYQHEKYIISLCPGNKSLEDEIDVFFAVRLKLSKNKVCKNGLKCH